MARIGIYGGSFNPPHNGHVLAASECLARLSLDKLIVIPNAVPPHKALPEGSPTAQQRLELTKLAFSFDQRIAVSDLELLREGKSYTSETLAELKKQYPSDELFLIMGTDMFLSFDTWHEPQRICENATLVCMHRMQKDSPAALQLRAEEYKKRFGAKTMFLENEVAEMSSTDVRRLLRFGCAEEYLPQQVLKAIEDNKLYRLGEDWTNLPFEELREKSLSLHDEKRKAHVIGCSKLSAELAGKYGLSEEVARRAGILHDVTKALPPHAQYAMCRHYHVALSGQEQTNPKLLHAITGAVAAQAVFGESAEVCMAIRWHTTGHRGMTTMEKILYIADYAEENRDFPGVEKLREVLKKDLDEAVLLGIEMTVRQLRENNQPICENTQQAYEDLTAKGTETANV